jgi:alkaline phosphatase
LNDRQLLQLKCLCADGKDPEKVINDGYGFEFPSKQMDKVKDAAKELKVLDSIRNLSL